MSSSGKVGPSAGRFGTSGWCGILAEDFTFSRVRRVVRAIADHLSDKGLASRGVVLARDGRFLGEQFIQEAAEVLAGAGIPSLVCPGMTPTPVVASCVLDLKAAGAINFTASHNPALYQGLKFNSDHAGAAELATTEDIEGRIEQALKGGDVPPRLAWGEARGRDLIRDVDPRRGYRVRLDRAIRWERLGRHGL